MLGLESVSLDASGCTRPDSTLNLSHERRDPRLSEILQGLAPGQWELYEKSAESRELDAAAGERATISRREEGWAARWWAGGAPRFACGSSRARDAASDRRGLPGRGGRGAAARNGRPPGAPRVRGGSGGGASAGPLRGDPGAPRRRVAGRGRPETPDRPARRERGARSSTAKGLDVSSLDVGLRTASRARSGARARGPARRGPSSGGTGARTSTASRGAWPTARRCRSRTEPIADRPRRVAARALGRGGPARGARAPLLRGEPSEMGPPPRALLSRGHDRGRRRPPTRSTTGRGRRRGASSSSKAGASRRPLRDLRSARALGVGAPPATACARPTACRPRAGPRRLFFETSSPSPPRELLAARPPRPLRRRR